MVSSVVQLVGCWFLVGRLVGWLIVSCLVAIAQLVGWWVDFDGQTMGGMREAGLLGLNQQNQQYQQK